MGDWKPRIQNKGMDGGNNTVAIKAARPFSIEYLE